METFLCKTNEESEIDYEQTPNNLPIELHPHFCNFKD